MHHAPSVDFPVGRSRVEGVVVGSVAALGAAVTVAWAVQAPPGSLGPVVAAVLWLASAVLAVRRWQRAPSGILMWRHAQWQWGEHAGGNGPTALDEAPAFPVRVAVALDLQRRLLLRFEAPPSRPRWLWVSREMAPARWDDLRRAVYSRATADALPDSPARADAPAAQP